ncbi:sensor histidine kinase [Pseudonocardia sp. DLS-67]
MTVRATIMRLAGATLIAATVIAGLVALGVRWVGEADGERTAHTVSTQVAASILVPLSRQDFSGHEDLDRRALLAELEPFLNTGMVYRVKVWAVTGDRAQIAFSDEPRVEAAERPFDPHLATRLDAGEAVVYPVPDDAEHRFESARADDLREVFIGFRDAVGNDSRLEVYVPVGVDTTVRDSMGVLLPLAVVGVLALGLALLPISVAVARRVDRDRREHRDAVHYGLAAAELARREVAQRLHDDVIPDLASTGLLLDTAAGVPAPGARALVADARARIGADVRRLRGLLTELTPPMVDPSMARDAFLRLVAGVHGGGPRITLEMADDLHLDAEVATLLHRATAELLRNAVTHSGARHVHVEVVRDGDRVLAAVADDGCGFDPAASSRPGHIGLLLVRRAVDDAGGTVVIRSLRDRDGRHVTGSRIEVVVPAVPQRSRPASDARQLGFGRYASAG